MKRILVADHSEIANRMFCAGLSKYGFSVSAVSTTEELIHKCTTEEIDMLLLDLYLEQTSQMDQIHYLRELCPEMYLIVMETAELTEANKLYKSYMAEKNALITTDMAREELNAEILNEYRREFWGEGQMFYAYKRLGVKEMMWKTDREVEEKDYIVPLPTTESGSN